MTEQQNNLNATITVKISNVNPGESGQPDSIAITVRITPGSPEYVYGQSALVTTKLESGSIRKDYDAAVHAARKQAGQILEAMAKPLQE